MQVWFHAYEAFLLKYRNKDLLKLKKSVGKNWSLYVLQGQKTKLKIWRTKSMENALPDFLALPIETLNTSSRQSEQRAIEKQQKMWCSSAWIEVAFPLYFPYIKFR